MANEDGQVLGRWASPYTHRIETAPKLKGIPYSYIEEDLTNKSSLLLKYNPVHKKVPILIHNGKSLVILEYIDETWDSNPILPKDPWEKSKARSWAKFIDNDLFCAQTKAFWSDEKECEEGMVEAMEGLRCLENELKTKGSTYFGGERIGLVDLVANGLGYWVRVQEEVLGKVLFSKEEFPLLWNWAQNFVSCDVVKECFYVLERGCLLYTKLVLNLVL